MTIPVGPAAFAKDRIEAAAAQLGLVLPHQEQWDFLQSLTSQDLQAAPGSGKTSLISLKLALLAQGWASPTRGVCVLSHTNTAKDEIASRLMEAPAGQRLLHYPHFIGTIQSFVNTFIALPAVRAKGVEVQIVDDAAYAAAALRMLEGRHEYRTLRSTLDRRWEGRNLVARARFVREGPELSVVPAIGTLPFAPDTPSGRQFIALKRRLAWNGIYRFDDMFAIAERHLADHPDIALAVSQRFPFVLLDEMQDTSAVQEKLLDTVFASSGSVVQRVGDVNQRIFADDAKNEMASRSFPMPGATELSVSRRFGSSIANLASELTVQRRQRIDGVGPQGTIALLLFEEGSVAEVVPAFERLAAEFVPEHLLLSNPPRVLGTRKKKGSSPKFPQSMACYVAGFAETPDPADELGRLLRATHTAQELWLAGEGHAAASTLWDTVRAVVRPSVETPLAPIGRLERDPRSAGGQVRALLVDMLTAPLDDEAAWMARVDRLVVTLSVLTGVHRSDLPRLDRVTEFKQQTSASNLRRGSAAVSSIAGTIQSAKGETHTATLIVDCLGRTGTRYDVKEAIALLAGQGELNRAPDTVKQAMQLIFVGATRPTHLLAFATLRQHAMTHLDVLKARGWSVRYVNAH
ncbi:UvrD-helicase domain-containing protein [Streptomyces scopuliridis]|uniref:UvrD-helicase domain-containing protein n=1 Tax=Streptomyces scopuliridis TaxID=452529 RepID=UPI0036C419EB